MTGSTVAWVGCSGHKPHGASCDAERAPPELAGAPLCRRRRQGVVGTDRSADRLGARPRTADHGLDAVRPWRARTVRRHGGSVFAAGTTSLTDHYELTMVGRPRSPTARPPALRASRSFAPAAARRPALRRGGRHRPAARTRSRGSASTTHELACAASGGASTRRTAGLARRLPLRGRHRRLPRGRAVLPRLADPDRRAARFAEARAAGDARAVDPQPRLRDRLRRGPDGDRRGRAVRCIEMGSRRTHEEAAVAAARAAYLAGFASTSNLAAGRAVRHPDRGHGRARLHPAARRRAGRLPRAGAGAGPGHHAARRHLRHRARASRPPSRSAGPGARRGPHRLRRSRRAGPPGPRAARRARRHRHPDRASPATSTSTRSPRSPPRRSTPTASAPRWSPAPARRPPAWSTSSCEVDGAAGREAQRRQGVATAAASRRCAGTSRRGTAVEEVVHVGGEPGRARRRTTALLPVPLVRGGEPVADLPSAGRVPRRTCARAGRQLPWDGPASSRAASRRSRPCCRATSVEACHAR